MDRPSADPRMAPEAHNAIGSALLLDLRHLDHQTLNDAGLRRIVLELFLGEAPHYAANLRLAKDRKDWRMAVHTLKGVALNLGAFPLAWLCKDYELFDTAADASTQRLAAETLAARINDTAAAIRALLAQG